MVPSILPPLAQDAQLEVLSLPTCKFSLILYILCVVLGGIGIIYHLSKTFKRIFPNPAVNRKVINETAVPLSFS